MRASIVASVAFLLAPAAPAFADIAIGGPPPEVHSGLAIFDAVSDDGRRVVFSSRRRLARGDRDRAIDVYAREKSRTALLSAGSAGDTGGARVEFAGATPDARAVLFRTEDRLTAEDADSSPDLYLRGPAGVSLISLAGASTDVSATWPRFHAVSDDGRRVLFTSGERLVAEDDDDEADIYEYRAGRAHLVSAGTLDGVTYLADAADGDRVLFSSSTPLSALDGDDQPDIYQRHRGATTLVSVGGGSETCTLTRLHPTDCPPSFAAVSTDGSRVFFETRERLVAGDTDRVSDVYAREGAGIALVSTGPEDTSTFGASLAAITPDGQRAFFVTGESFGSLSGDARCALFERRGGKTSIVSIGNRGPISVGCGPPKIAVSPDGARIIFSSGGMTNRFHGAGDVFMRAGGKTRLVSGNPPPPFDEFGAFLLHGSSTGAGRVVFLTPRRLDRRDRDNAYDIYAYSQKGVRVVSVGPAGGNADPSDPIGAFIGGVPTFGGATDDGRFIFFTTEDRLLRRDRNEDVDLYERGPSGLRLVSTR